MMTTTTINPFSTYTRENNLKTGTVLRQDATTKTITNIQGSPNYNSNAINMAQVNYTDYLAIQEADRCLIISRKILSINIPQRFLGMYLMT